MKYFKCVSLIAVSDEHWDSGCDETFGVAVVLKNCVLEGLVEYEEIPKEHFDNTHRIFTEEGGI